MQWQTLRVHDVKTEPAQHPDLSGVVIHGDRPLHERYAADAVLVFDHEERRRFYDAFGRPVDEERLDWELLYRLEPGLYERLIAGERIHPAIWQWLPESSNRVLELGAGTGRFTTGLAARCHELIATEPALPMLDILKSNPGLSRCNARYDRAFFDSIPVASSTCEVVVSCSSLVPRAERDPEACLNEMQRCCIPGGMIVVVWPNDVEWLASHGFTHVVFEGTMAVEFGTMAEAIELVRIFYPAAMEDVLIHDSPTVPYEMLSMSPPRDLCWRRV